MKMRLNVIMSAERAARTPGQDLANVQATNKLHGALYDRGMNFSPARGCYKGVEERAVVVAVGDSDDYDWLLEHAFTQLGQEAVLTVDPEDGYARMHYKDGRVERAGFMRQATEFEARQRDGWTRTPNPGTLPPWTYFVIDNPRVN